MTVLKVYKSAMMGVKAEIAPAIRGGFRMVLTDTDANEVVGVRVFPNIDMADAYAQSCVSVQTGVNGFPNVEGFRKAGDWSVNSGAEVAA